MLKQRSLEIAQRERTQRRALIIFALVLLVLLGLCGVFGLRLLTLPARVVPVGSTADFGDGAFKRISVRRLETSRLIVRRDSQLSEDTIFVRQAADGAWVALLGVDTLSGCFLYWDEPAQQFHDVNCQGSRYGPDGRYLGGLNTGETPQNMARMPVIVQDGQVFVRDEIAR